MIRVAPSALAALTQLLQGRTHSMKDTLSKAFIYPHTVVHTVYSNLRATPDNGIHASDQSVAAGDGFRY